MKIKSLLKTIIILSAATTLGITTSCINSIIPTAPIAPITPSVEESTTGPQAIPTALPLLDENGQPRKDLYISPYKPYNPINTKGYISGDTVGDPSTAAISEKTGKPVLSTSKAFRIP